MHVELFKEICKKITGYDAIVMDDGNIYRRCCITKKSLSTTTYPNFLLSDTYGFILKESNDRYEVVGGAKVLFCTSENIHTYMVGNKRRVLLNAIKDFKCYQE